jgi:general L-amino acid transport system substrate-binding protein
MADIEAQSAADVPQSPLFETDGNDDSSMSKSSDQGNNSDDAAQQPGALQYGQATEQARLAKSKRRRTGSGTPITIGATQVNERANFLYTRQYRGRNRLSQRLRRRAEREAEERGTVANNNEDGETNRRTSFVNFFGAASVRMSDDTSPVVSAILVEDADVVVATEMGFCEQNWKSISVFMTALLFILAILLSLFIADYEKEKQPQQLEPTASPAFDFKPTLQTVQERGFIRCGLNAQVTRGRFYLNLCRAVASVVVGDTNSYEIVPITLGNRWSILNNRTADLLVGADTHTIEREVRLASEASGFTFSAPYYYDGMVYAGNETYIECAETTKRYGICSSLSICVFVDSTSFQYLASNFPPKFYSTSSSMDEMMLMMANGTCNVVASEVSLILDSKELSHGVGKIQFTKEPHAFVTRNNDREFSDVVNWILQALFYGEEQGLMKNATLCSNSTNVTSVASELNYLNAVYCVGSYKDLHDHPQNRGMNRINNGTKMHSLIPFGDLDYVGDKEMPDFGPRPNSTFSGIMIDGKLNCGVAVQSDNDTESFGIVGMSTDCEYAYHLQGLFPLIFQL